MVSNVMTSSAWKAFLAKNREVKDVGLQRALQKLEGLKDDAPPESRLQALDEIGKLADRMQKDKAVKSVDAAAQFLEEVADECGRSRQEALAAQKAAAKSSAKTGEAKEADKEEPELIDVADGLARVKTGAGKVALQFALCPGKVDRIVIARRITPEMKEDLKKAAGGSRVLPVGTVKFEEGRFAFDMDGAKGGHAKSIQKAIKAQTGMATCKVRVRDSKAGTVIDDDTDVDERTATGADTAVATATGKGVAAIDAQKVGAPSTVMPPPGNLVNKPKIDPLTGKPVIKPEPPPEAGARTDKKTEVKVEGGATETTATATRTYDDGKGGKTELTGKATAKVNKSGGAEGSVTLGGSDVDASGEGGALNMKATGKVNAKTGEATFGAGADLTAKNDKGGETKTSVAVTNAGAEVGVTSTKRVGEESGSSVGAKGSVDWNKGTAGVSVEKKSQKKGEAEKSVGGGVTGTRSADGGGEVSFTGTKGDQKADKGQKLAVSFTIKSTWKVTREESGDFLVEYVGGAKASVGRTGQLSKDGDTKKYAVTGSASGGVEATFEKRFKTEKAARDFCAANTVPPQSGAGADVTKLQTGDTVGTTKSLGVGAGASANVEGISVGLVGNWGSSTTVRVKKASAKEVEVTYVDASQLGGGVSLGALMSMGVEGSKQTIDYTSVVFDITTPEGVAAFNAFRETGKLSGAGYKAKSGKTTVGQMKKTIGFGPASISFGATTSSTEGTDEEGRKVLVEEGTAEMGGEFKPFGGELKLPGGKKIDLKSVSDWHKEKHTLNVTEIDGQAAFVLRSSVDSKGAKGTARTLAEVTATKRDNVGDEVASGKWTAEMSVTPAEMERFAALVPTKEGDQKANLALGTVGRGDYEQLVADLAKAGDDGKAWYQALTRFFSETGGRGITYLQVLLGKKEMDLELDPAADKENVWLNLEEFEAMSSRIAVMERKVAAKKADQALRVDLADVKSALRKKSDLVKNDARFREVSKEAKQRYLGKLKKVGSRLEALQKQVDEALAPKKVQSTDDPATRFVHDGQRLFEAMASAETGVDRWKVFVKSTWTSTQFKISGGPAPQRVTKPVDEAIRAGDEALAQFADSRELAERGVAELQANPCQAALDNLTYAVEEGRQKLRAALDAHRRGWTALQGVRDYHRAEFEKNRKDRPSMYSGVAFALEEFPKAPPPDVVF